MGRYDELFLGDKSTFTKTISESDVYMFAGITGDFNPAHINEQESMKSKFGGRIVHGLLTAGFISNVIGMKLPGPGTIYLEQNLTFLSVTLIGDTITAEVEVIDKLEKGRIRLKTTVRKSSGEVVIEGDAVVIAPR